MNINSSRTDCFGARPVLNIYILNIHVYMYMAPHSVMWHSHAHLKSPVLTIAVTTAKNGRRGEDVCFKSSLLPITFDALVTGMVLTTWLQTYLGGSVMKSSLATVSEIIYLIYFTIRTTKVKSNILLKHLNLFDDKYFKNGILFIFVHSSSNDQRACLQTQQPFAAILK